MKISGRQKRALEKLTGRPWDSWLPEAVKAYFAFTDRGIRTDLFTRVWRLHLQDHKFTEVEQALWDLMQHHVFHPVDVESWKEDFKRGLLFLSDFEGYPREYIKHACDIYTSSMGLPIPSCFKYLLED